MFHMGEWVPIVTIHPRDLSKSIWKYLFFDADCNILQSKHIMIDKLCNHRDWWLILNKTQVKQNRKTKQNSSRFENICFLMLIAIFCNQNILSIINTCQSSIHFVCFFNFCFDWRIFFSINVNFVHCVIFVLNFCFVSCFLMLIAIFCNQNILSIINTFQSSIHFVCFFKKLHKTWNKTKHETKHETKFTLIEKRVRSCVHKLSC